MQIAINPTLYGSAQIVPDVVLSLLGAGEPVAKDDLNGCDAYYHYLEEKYKWHDFYHPQCGRFCVSQTSSMTAATEA